MNTFFKLLMLAAVVSSSLILSACGSSVAGEYDFRAPELNTHLSLTSDGKLAHTAVFFGRSIGRYGTWKADGDKIAATVDGVTQTFTIDGDTLTMPGGQCTRHK